MTKELLVWCHPMMNSDNHTECLKHWNWTPHLDKAHIAFINHRTDQAPLTENENIKMIASNTTNSILTVGEDIPAEGWDYLWLGDPARLETITATAEHTLGLILSCHRNIPKAMRHVESGQWNRYILGAPKMLSRSVITIIGHGRIGRRLASYCEPLFKTVCIVQDTPRWRDNLHLLLPGTDVLVICASKNKEYIVGHTEIFLLPQDAIIVNTSCAENLDTRAALDALEDRRLWGVALDVLSEMSIESLTDRTSQSPENLIITPHIGGSTKDAWYNTQRWVIEKVLENL